MMLKNLREPLEWCELPDRLPGPGEVRVKVAACGVCRTDLHVVDGELPYPRVPIIPGHGVVGRIDAVGAGVMDVRAGTGRRSSAGFGEELVRPTSQKGTWWFGEIDVARLRLIRDLRHDLGLPEDALPVVLRLLDQLYDERRRLRLMRDALDRSASPQVRDAVLQALRDPVES